jgi:hypothetical protein
MAAMRDIVNNTPFSLAFLRGHYDVARAILEIVKAQWTPVEKDKVRYKVEDHREEDYDSEEESEGNSDSDSEEVRVVTETLHEKFTIDDLGKVSMQVKSHKKPLETLLQRVMTFKVNGVTDVPRLGVNSLFEHVIAQDDTAGLKFLLELAGVYSGQKLEGEEMEEECNFKTFTFPQEVFMSAIRLNKTQMLSLIIKKTGAGIPLDHLVKGSGGGYKEKPRYYQGLTVYGRKR